MKDKGKKYLSAVLCILMLVIFTFTSCYVFDETETLTETETKQAESTGADDGNETAGGENDGGEEGEGNIVSNIIINTGADNVAYAAAQGLRSAVSIYCTFEAVYGGTSQWRPNQTVQTYYTTGAGVLYQTEADGSAFIITNHHVVYDLDSTTDNHISDEIYVYLYGLESEAYAIPAEYVGGSASYDIAVLRVSENEILKNAVISGAAAPISVANSDNIAPGSTVIAIGNPSTDEVGGISVTSGIVSVASEYITMSAVDGSGDKSYRVIRTDTPINSGNSGGGLYNAKGELVGIVNAKITSSDIENIGYALPSNVVRAVVDNIIDNCYLQECESVMRATLGIGITVSAVSTSYDTETGSFICTEEICVSQITEGSLADGIFAENDIVKSITIGDTTVDVSRRHHLIDAILDVRTGDTVIVVVLREGEETELQIEVTEACLQAF